VPAPVPIDHHPFFDDVVAVAKSAHAPTAGFRAMCVRAQRTVGKGNVQPLAMLDLDDEIPPLSARVRQVLAGVPPEIDTLLFSLFDGVDDDGEGVFTGLRLSGMMGFDRNARWLLREPAWAPDDGHLASPALDAIARAATRARGDAKRAISHGLRFGAAALLARFAVSPLPYRVVVGFDEGDVVDVTAR
jgi:hypothetical protein